MKHTMLLAPAAFFAVGMFATPSQAHGSVVVGLPPVVIDTGTVTVAIGTPPPPPPVVVVEQPRRERVVVVERAPPPPQTVVVVRDRTPDRVVYVDDRCDHPGRGNHYGKHKHKHVKHHGHHGYRDDDRDDDRGRGKGRGKHRGYDT